MNNLTLVLCCIKTFSQVQHLLLLDYKLRTLLHSASPSSRLSHPVVFSTAMATSFDYDINSPSDNHVYDDEELALQLLAEELAFHSPSGNNWREGVPYAESPQAQSMACITQRDLELARMLQTREDEQSMFASSTENSRTDLELAKILQVDADEEMVVESAAEDKKSDLELAMLLQQQEDITANDFLIARQLQVLTKSKLRD